ncbi:integrase family protein [Pikeienuella sp. HZG-20]|uniref:tyrosine-type recombinase/integrase n=1 Tax=Paludibacillus litoralis TaxID=3133267 RepID=UPI0030EF0D11
MKIDLTDAFLKNVEASDDGRLEIADAKRPGLVLRVYPGGRKIWMFEKRVKGGAKRKHTLGEYPKPVSLADARRTAQEIAAEAARGFDRIVEAEKSERAAEAAEKASVAAEAAKVSVASVIERYDALHLSPNLRTAADRRRQLEQALAPFLESALCDLTRKELQGRIDEKAKEGRIVMANRIKSALSAFTKWAWRRGYTETDIGAGLSKAANEKPRDVVLSVSQVREIWKATQTLGDIWGPLFRLLIITAQRRGDIGGLRWSEVEETRLVIGGDRTKNSKPHVVHLSVPAKAELDALPRDGALVFTTTGSTPVSGFSKAKARLDALLKPDFPAWRLHDLRTAFATQMAETGESEAVVDRILNHVASVSAASAVARVYNRAEQLPQRARALDRWAALIISTLGAAVHMRKL